MAQEKPKASENELSPEDIRRIRETLGLTQVEAGELLGGGPRAFTKYENGTIKPAASVISLLRLLESAPHELRTLTGRRLTPLDNEPRPFEVAMEHVRALSSRKFVLLVGRLLAAEARASGLPADGIHVAAQITVGDGGEDARFQWSNGPDHTPFVPNRLTQFQLKATKVTEGAAAKEVLTAAGTIKPMIQSVLAAGGTYILLMTAPAVKKALASREAAICKTLKEKGLAIRQRQVQVRDAAQIALWVNTHPGVAAWLLDQTQPGLTGPFRSWSHWAGRHEHDSSPWVHDPRLPPFHAELRQLVTTPRSVVRVVGPSGVGKSRLTLEALGPDEVEEAGGFALSNLVLYAVESEAGSVQVKAAVQHLADAGVRAIVVVDRCDVETHEDLAGMAKRAGSRLSLVTIDHDYFLDGPPPPGTLVIPKADKQVVEGVIRNVFPAADQREQQRVAHFAAGFPQAARLLAESWEGSFIDATTDALIDRVILGRRPVNKEQVQEAGMLLSVFGLIGVKPPLDEDIEHVAALPGAPSTDQLRAAFEYLTRRGVAQTRGRLLTLQPPPITLPLAQRQWLQWDGKTHDWILTELPSIELRQRAAHQLSLLNREESALEIVRHVCRLDGPFGSVKKLQARGATRILSSLAEVDAEAVVQLLDFVLGALDVDALRCLEGDTRRHLVWALEKIAFRDDTFEAGARLLLALAAAENESWSNNATGQFKALFAGLGGNTAAGPNSRLRMLDDALLESDDRTRPILVEALLSGANIKGGGVRIVGAELHGSRPALSPWMPAVWKEVWDYVGECLTRLATLASRDDTAGRRARAGLGADFRSLVARGAIAEVNRVFDIVVPKTDTYWPEALASLGDALVYDLDRLQVGEVERVRELIRRLEPKDLSTRLRFLVTEMPWDYPVDEPLDFKERERRQREDVENLAKEALGSPQLLAGFLPQLSSGKQRMAVIFGRALAEKTTDTELWLERITAAYQAAPTNDGNFGLLAGFLGGLTGRDPDRVSAFKAEAAQSSQLAPTLPFVCISVGLTDSDIALVIPPLKSGLLPAQRLEHWAFGGTLAKLPVESVAALLDALFDIGGDAYSIGLDLMGMYVYGDHGRLEQLRPQLRRAADRVTRSAKKPGSQMDAHHFKEIMEWALNKGRSDSDATAIALSLARQLVSQSEEGNDNFIRPLLPQLLLGFPEIVWPVIGQAIVQDRTKAWHLELSLGDSFSFDTKNPVILHLPEEVLFAWCHAHRDIAPAFVAALLPVLTSRDPNDPNRGLAPQMKRLLDEFGDRHDVLRALSRNMYTFGWSGSRATYFALYEGPLRSLEQHPHGAVRRWAKRTLLQIKRDIAHARDEDEERDASWGL